MVVVVLLWANALWVTGRSVLGRGDLLHRLLSETHPVACREAEGVGCPLVDLFGGVVVLALRELDDGQGLHVLAAESEPVPLQQAVGVGRRVPLQ